MERTTLRILGAVAIACSSHAENEPSPLVTSMFEGARVSADLPLEDAQLHRDELCDAFQANLRALITTEEATKSCGAEALVGALIGGKSDAEAVLLCEADIDDCASLEALSYYDRCPKNVVEGVDGCTAALQVFAECEEAHFRRQKAALAHSCDEWLTLEDEGVPDACRSERLPGPCGTFLSFATWPITGTDFPDGG